MGFGYHDKHVAAFTRYFAPLPILVRESYRQELQLQAYLSNDGWL
jgi:hypothetical protein